MKSKHYPAVTLFGAVTLTCMPLLLLLIGMEFRDRTMGSEDSLSMLIAASNPTPAPVRVAVAASGTGPAGTTRDVPVASVNPPVQWIPSVPSPTTRPPQTFSPAPVPEVAVPSISAIASVTDSARALATNRVPVSSDMSTEAAKPPSVVMPAEVHPVLVQTRQTPEENAAQSAIDATLEMPHRPDVDQSYYAATGHLALAAQPQVADPLAKSDTPDSPPEDDAKKSPASKTRKDRNRKSTDEPADEGTVADMSETVRTTFPELPARSDAAERPEAVAVLEEVLLQTPMANGAVDRVENVVAITRAKGWPIALVKSDLPDDVWWVQQVVGIQGNAFAARVNFGNEASIRGSWYHMVIVFLDSPDEVRRFRIAKQFKEIPAGVRRSREFSFIRN